MTHEKENLRERRKKIKSRLVRKYSAIEDLLFYNKNTIVVEEEMKQFNDLFKKLLRCTSRIQSVIGG